MQQTSTTQAREAFAERFAGVVFAHGQRSKYVLGCRCTPCRDAHAAYARERAKRRRLEFAARVAEAGGVNARAADVGRRGARFYRRPCPGFGGTPCEHRSHLRHDSFGGLCRQCRIRVTSAGLVPAERAKEHLIALSRQGIGREAVSEASGVSRSQIHRIVSGGQRRIRRSTERALLDVDERCRADGALVPADQAWRAVRRLLALGWSRQGIARALGSTAREPKLQISRRAVLLRTADRLARLVDVVERERESPRAQARRQVARLVAGGCCPRCGQSHEGDELAASWCLEHAAVPLTEQERMNTVSGTSPATADVHQP